MVPFGCSHPDRLRDPLAPVLHLLAAAALLSARGRRRGASSGAEGARSEPHLRQLRTRPRRSIPAARLPGCPAAFSFRARATRTQKHPNAINFPASVHPGREDEIIRPDQGERYSHTMVIKFSAE
jgi:hypothetical protein